LSIQFEPGTLMSPNLSDSRRTETPDEIIHIDIKTLGRFDRIGHPITGDASGPNRSRGAGWDFVHVHRLASVASS
jgi:hypothetical protein